MEWVTTRNAVFSGGFDWVTRQRKPTSQELQDSLADLYEDSREIQDIMGRAYGVPEDVDEDDLEAGVSQLPL